jgi:pheromone shutdown protein TraB
MRGQNIAASEDNRIGDRTNCFESTLMHLTERFNDREVYLIGSMNASTMLANRTKKLIQEVEPDTVIVQSNDSWWNLVRDMKYVDNQEEFDEYNDELEKFQFIKTPEEYYGVNKTKAILQTGAAVKRINTTFGVNYDFHLPGLEVKYACDEAEALGARLLFAGHEFDQVTWERLIHEKRINLRLNNIVNKIQLGKRWRKELYDNIIKIETNSSSQFVEKALDQEMVAWYIQCLDKLYPWFKRIVIDQKDEDLFAKIDQAEGKKIVAVVNQWHMEGIEHHWCHRYGQVPRNVIFPEGINPIGDMNLREGLFERQYNALHRQIVCSNSKAEPTTLSDWITGYHREADWHYHHRCL